MSVPAASWTDPGSVQADAWPDLGGTARRPVGRRRERLWALVVERRCAAPVIDGRGGADLFVDDDAPASPVGLSPSELVDTFVGTGVGGKSVGSIDTFPGADMPFGMMQWSPDTTPDRTTGGGYSYKDSAISGFSLTHMSGPGCAVYGDIPILPTVGAIGNDPAAARAPFSHSTEVASPGNYAVTEGSPAVRVELAVTTRTGLGRFSFPGTGSANVLFKVADSAAGSTRSAVTVVGDREVDGSVVSGDFCGTSGNYHLYFAARFDRGFESFGTWHGTTVSAGSRSSTTARSGAYVSFPARTRVVQMQVGVSFVSVADARLNIEAERPGWDIDALRRRDTATWNQLLGQVQVSGGTYGDERTFYSELYHSLLHPNVFDDANGRVHRLRRQGACGEGLHAVLELLGMGHLPQRGAAAGPPRPPPDERHGHLAPGRRQPGWRPSQVARGQPRERPDERGLRRPLHRLGLRLRGPGLRRLPGLGRHGAGGPPTPP